VRAYTRLYRYRISVRWLALRVVFDRNMRAQSFLEGPIKHERASGGRRPLALRANEVWFRVYFFFLKKKLQDLSDNFIKRRLFWLKLLFSTRFWVLSIWWHKHLSSLLTECQERTMFVSICVTKWKASFIVEMFDYFIASKKTKF